MYICNLSLCVWILLFLPTHLQTELDDLSSCSDHYCINQTNDLKKIPPCFLLWQTQDTFHIYPKTEICILCFSACLRLTTKEKNETAVGTTVHKQQKCSKVSLSLGWSLTLRLMHSANSGMQDRAKRSFEI